MLNYIHDTVYAMLFKTFNTLLYNYIPLCNIAGFEYLDIIILFLHRVYIVYILNILYKYDVNNLTLMHLDKNLSVYNYVNKV